MELELELALAGGLCSTGLSGITVTLYLCPPSQPSQDTRLDPRSTRGPARSGLHGLWQRILGSLSGPDADLPIALEGHQRGPLELALAEEVAARGFGRLAVRAIAADAAADNAHSLRRHERKRVSVMPRRLLRLYDATVWRMPAAKVCAAPCPARSG